MITIKKEEFEQRLKEKTIIDKETECWLWQGNLTNGYGRLSFDSLYLTTHRLSAYLYLDLDLADSTQHALHKPICKNKNCWNPKHLYVGTHQDNMNDRNLNQITVNQNTFKTHCPQGHEFTSENTYNTKRGKRLCKICESEKNKRYYYTGTRKEVWE